MIYERIQKGRFLKRPNRFTAKIEINGKEETVHVKNTGRCAELLVSGAEVFVQKSESAERKTGWDLIGVRKADRLINMDSQVTNKVVQEWIEAGRWFKDVKVVRPEVTYKNSRFDLYVEYEEKKAFIEVKGVTLEEEGVVKFPDAPSERAVKHLKELEAAENGVQVIAKDCFVTEDSIAIADEVPVVLNNPQLYEAPELLVEWYRERKRDLPWRHHVNAYRVWVSEIMLQQTRVEAVKPFFERFMTELPTVKNLAEAPEDKLLKLWEGLGYYNRVRNMQKAARKIEEEYAGKFPENYEEIKALPGIGNYTAGAISSFAYGIPKPAVDGNVLRVVSRLLASDADIMKASVRTKIENAIEPVIPEDAASDFNQGLIELGAIVCVPNGEAKCEICPLTGICEAKRLGIQNELPVKKKAKARKIEERTVLIFKDGDHVAIRKRPDKGLLAGMYEFPNLDGKLTMDEVTAYSKSIGLAPVRVKKLRNAKHIFSHIEWHMTAYEVIVDELEKNCKEEMIFAHPEEIQKKYSMPSAFSAWKVK